MEIYPHVHPEDSLPKTIKCIGALIASATLLTMTPNLAHAQPRCSNALDIGQIYQSDNAIVGSGSFTLCDDEFNSVELVLYAQRVGGFLDEVASTSAQGRGSRSLEVSWVPNDPADTYTYHLKIFAWRFEKEMRRKEAVPVRIQTSCGVVDVGFTVAGPGDRRPTGSGSWTRCRQATWKGNLQTWSTVTVTLFQRGPEGRDVPVARTVVRPPAGSRELSVFPGMNRTWPDRCQASATSYGYYTTVVTSGGSAGRTKTSNVISLPLRCK